MATSIFNNNNVTLKACIFTYCPQENTRSSGALCDDWLVPTGNQTCGEEGPYNISGREYIPEADIPDTLSWLVGIHIGVDQDECQASGGGESVDEEPMSYSMMGAIFGTAFGAIVAGRRRCQEDEYEDDDYDDASTFVEMRDAVCGV